MAAGPLNRRDGAFHITQTGAVGAFGAGMLAWQERRRKVSWTLHCRMGPKHAS